MSSLEVKATTRGGAAGGLSALVEQNELHELFTAQGLPPFTEVTRKGDGWSIQTSTLFAPLVAVPTTVAALEIYNNMLAASVALVISDVFAMQVLATAAAQTYAIYACVSTQKAAPANSALDIFSSSGRAKYTTSAAGRIIAGIGTTVVANGWRPWGPPQAWGTATATPGNAWNAPVDGKLIVPPGCALLLHVVGALATASTFQVGASWYEAKIAVAA